MITTIVLAAGLSTRMGSQKLLLPWGDHTIISRILETLKEAGLADILVVTGAVYKELENSIQEAGGRLLFNHDYANGEMLVSLQVGLMGVGKDSDAIMVVLGDQPQIEISVITDIIKRFMESHHPIIVPSYKMRRGHPWLLGKPFWEEVLALRPPHTLRDFLNTHHELIDYVIVNTPSILHDVDTREDYLRSKP